MNPARNAYLRKNLEKRPRKNLGALTAKNRGSRENEFLDD